MYEILLTPDSAKAYERASASLQRRLDRCFEQLKREPRSHPNIKALKGQWAGLRRYRSGDYRIVYRIDEPVLTVIVIAIGHRRDIYD